MRNFFILKRMIADGAEAKRRLDLCNAPPSKESRKVCGGLPGLRWEATARRAMRCNAGIVTPPKISCICRAGWLLCAHYLYLAGFPGALYLRPSPLRCIMQLLEKIELEISTKSGIKACLYAGWGRSGGWVSQG